MNGATCGCLVVAKMRLGGAALANAFRTIHQLLHIIIRWPLRWLVSFQALLGLDEFADSATEEVGLACIWMRNLITYSMKLQF